MPSHHEVLGVAADASRREVNAAYRRLAKQYHPDVEGGDAARFQLVTEAYNALTAKSARATPEAARPAEPAARPAAKARKPQARRASFLQRRAYLLLACAAFVLGLFLLDRGDGIHAAFRPGLLVAGAGAILLSAGFFTSRRRDYLGLADAMEQAVLAVFRFFLDVLMRVYLALLFVFSVVALLALVNWLEGLLKR
jgi:hypothetical protein